jgi:uncharacterized phage protein gp47/JayE
MFESDNFSFKAILAGMLAWIRNFDREVDTSPRSPVYMAAAPAALEHANMYVAADGVLQESFADTASREYLVRRAAERGMTPDSATASVCRGEFSADVPINSRFALADAPGLNWFVLSKIGDGVFRMQAETPGLSGNRTGNLLPVDFVGNLEYARLTEILIPGEDEEDTEHFRRRYFESFDIQAFGGNKKDYRDKTNSLPGVGDTKVYPVWNGGGTVRLVIISAAWDVPSPELIDAVRQAIDPPPGGSGNGTAPIGHIVTVAGVAATPIDIVMTIMYQTGWNWASIAPYAEAAIDEYFAELRRGWADTSNIVVRRSQIESRMLDLEGVLDIIGITLNGTPENKIMGADNVPERGDVSG